MALKTVEERVAGVFKRWPAHEPITKSVLNEIEYELTQDRQTIMDTLIERLERERRTYEGHSMGTHEGISFRIRVDQHNTTLDTAIAIIREVMSK